MAKDLTLGIEEEYQVCDPRTGDLTPGVELLLGAAPPALRERLSYELLHTVLEGNTAVAETVDDGAVCPGNAVCQNGICVAGNNGCQADSDCPAGQLCVGGACMICQNGACFTPCSSNADCSPAQTCQNGACTP